MPEYWVIGGEYTDTNFEQFADGKGEERYGPYADYQAALKEWNSRSFSQVDDCYVRYRVTVEAEPTTYWVVGGEYTDTHFDTFVPGKGEERYGPFMDYQAALKEWQGRSFNQVDDCNVRYRVVVEGGEHER